MARYGEVALRRAEGSCHRNLGGLSNFPMLFAAGCNFDGREGSGRCRRVCRRRRGRMCLLYFEPCPK
ncbi:hypothetical protein BZL29_5542 [Mycobacterium kansasii]|uniref:Uncharacterized protein n=1 Tax=Mycobacterium kansasii TaxID=1768 RepID=A0A1V3WX66_MYCKA|nr:hypothetical protein BZL29_5542 [Mycobacterium kansasii]